jgi:hypothetical protein
VCVATRTSAIATTRSVHFSPGFSLTQAGVGTREPPISTSTSQLALLGFDQPIDGGLPRGVLDGVGRELDADTIDLSQNSQITVRRPGPEPGLPANDPGTYSYVQSEMSRTMETARRKRRASGPSAAGLHVWRQERRLAMKTLKWLSSLLCALGMIGAWVAGSAELAANTERETKERVFRFAKDESGKVPKGWTAAKTGKGEGSMWKVVADETSPSKTGYALAQVAKSPNALFNLCVVNDTNGKDVAVSVAMKAVAGAIDQGGRAGVALPGCEQLLYRPLQSPGDQLPSL